MKWSLRVICVAFFALFGRLGDAHAQQSCAKYGVGSGHLNATTQANYVVARCDTTQEKVRMITVWHGVSRSVPQDSIDTQRAGAHSRALRALTAGELKGYVPGGMSSMGGAWYLAVHPTGVAAVAYTDPDARPHVLQRYALPAEDSTLVVFLEHREWPETPVVIGTEMIPVSIAIPRADPRERQATVRAMLDIVLQRTILGQRR